MGVFDGNFENGVVGLQLGLIGFVFIGSLFTVICS
jgi:hypothetical protein